MIPGVKAMHLLVSDFVEVGFASYSNLRLCVLCMWELVIIHFFKKQENYGRLRLF